jgi:hypothetical protein
MRNKKWVRLLAYVTGSVNEELLLQNEYLAAENRILRAKLPSGRTVSAKRSDKSCRGAGIAISPGQSIWRSEAGTQAWARAERLGSAIQSPVADGCYRTDANRCCQQ